MYFFSQEVAHMAQQMKWCYVDTKEYNQDFSIVEVFYEYEFPVFTGKKF